MARVTFGLPVYNGEKYLARALDSLLAQDYGDLEIHILDNASGDGTRAISEGYVARDRRVSYARNDRNLGAAGNFNLVFERSQTELFAWAAYDDLWAPAFLSRCIAALDARPDAVAAHSWVNVLDFDGRPYPEQARDFLDGSADLTERFRAMIQDHWAPLSIYSVFRASALRRTHLLKKLMGGDAVLLTELALQGAFVQVREPLWTYHTAGFAQGASYVERIRAALSIEGDRAQRLFPRLLLMREFMRVAVDNDQPAAIKAQLAAHVLRWYGEALLLPGGRALLRLLLGEEGGARLLERLHGQAWYRRLRHIDP